jgi:hypothetical protein
VSAPRAGAPLRYRQRVEARSATPSGA